MASRLIGRTACPECGFESAHVKQAEGEGKRPYRFCPDCGAQYFPKNDQQAKQLADKTRQVSPAPAPAPTPSPEPAPQPAPAKTRRSLSDLIL